MIAGLVNRLWLASTWPAACAFRRSLADPASTQFSLLRHLLRRDAETWQGRRLGFAGIVSPADFRDRVPLHAWEDVAPAVERIRAGEARVLSGEPVLRLVPTSGSTAACKLVPWTRGMHAAFGNALAPWIHDLAARHPGMRGGPAYWAVSPPAQPVVVAGRVPIGFGDDTDYLGGLLGPLMARALAVPPRDPALADPHSWLDATCVHLLCCRDLRLISVWHPSFLTLILDRLHHGREALLARLPTADARRLDGADFSDPAALWPRLALVSCWADGPAAMPAAMLAERIAPVAMLRKGLLSTEGVISVPYGGAMPLALRSHVLELLDADGRVHWAHDLRPGMRGEVVLSNGGGLWRYRTGDLVEVDGMVAATPSLRFLGRRGTVHDLAGEKLDEAQVAAAFLAAGVRAAFAALRPLPRASPSGWVLVLDRDAAEPELTANRVEAALMGCVHYGVARRLGQIAPLQAQVDPRTAAEIVAALARDRGLRPGALKPPLMLPA